MKLSIIVPVYNEERTVGLALQRLFNLALPGWEKEILVVDDGSTDNSKVQTQKAKFQFQNQNLKLLFHEVNEGKGAAIRTALKEAAGDYVIIQDADAEYDPKDIPVLLAAAQTKNAPVVYGSRNIHPRRTGYPHYVLGVWVLTTLTNILYRSNLTDVYTGYKLFRTSVLRSLNLQSQGFEFEAEVTAKLLKRGIPIVEVAIDYSPRRFAEGKKIRFRDALLGFWTILKNRL